MAHDVCGELKEREICLWWKGRGGLIAAEGRVGEGGERGIVSDGMKGLGRHSRLQSSHLLSFSSSLGTGPPHLKHGSPAISTSESPASASIDDGSGEAAITTSGGSGAASAMGRADSSTLRFFGSGASDIAGVGVVLKWSAPRGGICALVRWNELFFKGKRFSFPMGVLYNDNGGEGSIDICIRHE